MEGFNMSGQTPSAPRMVGPTTDAPIPYTLTAIGALLSSPERDLLPAATITRAVLTEVQQERAAQDARWGEQNHPDGTGAMHTTWVANATRRRADEAAKGGTLTWRHILEEEVCEAFAETDPDALCAELTQVAAVAVCWIESIRRRQADAVSHVAGDGSHA